MFANIRYALRQLRQAPGFAFTAVLTLALGIGAPTALFAVLDAVLLQPLPFTEPDRLVAVAAVPDPEASIPTMQDWQSQSGAFRSLAAYSSWSPEQKPTNGVTARRILVVSQGFFATLGARFEQGTNWPATGNEADCPTEAVVSGQFWNRLGGGRLGGRSLLLDGRTFPIVGVLSMEQQIEGSSSINRPEVFLPVGCDPDERALSRGNSDFELLGRLRPGISAVAAVAALAPVDLRLSKQYPGTYAYAGRFRKSPTVTSYVEYLVGSETRTALLGTFAACGLLLAIACANLTNLLLAHSTRRRSEFALRATLGASLGQLRRQMLVENAILVMLGAGSGIALAGGLIRLLQADTTLHLPRFLHASIRPGVVLFTVAVSAVVAGLLTWFPARRTVRPQLLTDLRTSDRSSAAGSLRLVGRLLVVAQLTLTLVLLACAGWLTGSVYTLLHQPLGFQPEHLLLARVQLPPGDRSKEQVVRSELKVQQIGLALRQLPGVLSVAATNRPPLGQYTNRYGFCSDAHPEQCKLQHTLNPNSSVISPGYFATIGQTLLEGRDFASSDDGRNPVAIVNQALAAREWPGKSALFHRVFTGETQRWATVVGVVADIHSYNLVSAPEPDLYIPRAEDPSGNATFALHVEWKPELLEQTADALLRQLAPEATSRYAESLEGIMQTQVADRAFLMQAAGAFAATALFLAILGTYGLLAYEVSLREKEIGIRLALGSSREAIVRLLLRQEGRWLVLGTVAGLGSAAAAGYLLRTQFYGVRGASVPVLLGSATLLLLPALAAVALPARRAAMQDPAQMLRRE